MGRGQLELVVRHGRGVWRQQCTRPGSDALARRRTCAHPIPWHNLIGALPNYVPCRACEPIPTLEGAPPFAVASVAFDGLTRAAGCALPMPAPLCRSQEPSFIMEACYTLINAPEDQEPPTEAELKKDLEDGKMQDKIDAMKKLITLIMAGERFNSLLIVRAYAPPPPPAAAGPGGGCGRRRVDWLLRRHETTRPVDSDFPAPRIGVNVVGCLSPVACRLSRGAACSRSSGSSCPTTTTIS